MNETSAPDRIAITSPSLTVSGPIPRNPFSVRNSRRRSHSGIAVSQNREAWPFSAKRRRVVSSPGCRLNNRRKFLFF